MASYAPSAALAACLTLAAAAPAAAQVRPMSAEAPPAAARAVLPQRDATAESVITWYGELQRIAAHLQWVHDRALMDPALEAARARLVQAVQAAMDRADPELPRLAARAERIPAEHEAATRRGDGARAQALHREMAQIQARFMNVEAAVLRTPEIQRRSRAYEEQLRGRMTAIEPMVEQLLERSAELQRLLQGTLARPE